ncbi:hypothetical protein [Xanthomonas vasicola]|uniref:hypothetical protein n=1 Tax=Xanthomonas vasicola TaxID=56459 RepID=UPI001E50462F|nr:hypothetical protein [Xanthomonas vasicola]MDO6985096.1 hypothetical protein [Xanthomonas vasicola]
MPSQFLSGPKSSDTRFGKCGWLVGTRGVLRFYSRAFSVRATLALADVAAGRRTDGACYRADGWKAVFGKHPVNTVLALCLAPPLLGFLCRLALARGGPWVYTRTAGTDFEEVHVMQTAYVRTARTCKYRLSGGPLEHRFPNHLCIDEHLYRRHPEQQVPMRLRGQLSVLGMRIAASAEDP